ncbi:D-methionine transport system permease protein [Alkalihalobacillus xiaoxiensis]|uniref:D-methionine transport system permease protein n=1 Tax=Shouchella xiaoxiensis TaxID=766895 RepID=A0ABS2SUQ7_9BACI|nr:methionine ABC transporter permease [Shouchella xiaoxiensis]MBM7839241.1 D-methionine transport system permease protein [Shouchella xiaoxiensis]
MLNWLPEAIQPQITSEILVQALYDTLYMVAWSLLFSTIIGILLGVILVVTRPGHIMENRFIYSAINPIINVIRSVPFIILLVALIPVTRFINGVAIGATAAIIPLVVYAGPYIARLVENSLLEIDSGIIEAAEAMGATKWQIIFRFLVPEAMSSLILTMTTATIGLVGATAMAGAIGAGGIGDVAIAYGYQRYDDGTTLLMVVLLVLIVQGLQSLGNVASKRVRRR